MEHVHVTDALMATLCQDLNMVAPTTTGDSSPERPGSVMDAVLRTADSEDEMRPFPAQFVSKSTEPPASTIGASVPGSVTLAHRPLSQHMSQPAAATALDKFEEPFNLEVRSRGFKRPKSTPSYGLQGYVSSSQMLSAECQRRKFNPSFKISSNEALTLFRGQVTLCGVVIKGDSTYRSEREAREEIAKKALDFLQTNPAGLPNPAVKVASQPRGAVGRRKTAQRAGAGRGRLSSVPKARPVASTMDRYVPPQMPRAKPHTNRYEVKKEPGTSTNDEKIVDLPGNVNAMDVDNIVAQTVNSGAATIILNLPSDVSQDVAQAYGRAFRRLADRPREQSRSPTIQRSRSPLRQRARSPPRQRSRSPPRQPRADRDRRDHDLIHDYDYYGRQYHPRSSYRY